MTTTLAKTKEVKRQWHELDASKQPLGRLAVQAAALLIGKHKPSYTPHVDGGDFVVILNAENPKVTGRKALQKEYFNYSGYPGGLRRQKFEEVLEKNPNRIVWEAVRGMLPDNRLRTARLKRLKLVKGTEHKFKIDKKANG